MFVKPWEWDLGVFSSSQGFRFESFRCCASLYRVTLALNGSSLVDGGILVPWISRYLDWIPCLQVFLFNSSYLYNLLILLLYNGNLSNG
jgi:hypothetical protein